MMVVHEDNERPVEVSVIKKPLLEQKSYVIIKNHVRELTSIKSTQNEIKNATQKTENEDKKNKTRTGNKMCNTEEMPTTSQGSDFIGNKLTEIEPNDLEELKTVYIKCKEVMRRIETKYAHLLDLNDETEHNRKRRKQNRCSETSEDECKCQLNKKIIFDDDGRQLTVDNTIEKHICVKKKNKIENKNRKITIEEPDIVLPDNLSELGNMLHDPNIEKTQQNRILEKIKSLKQDYINEIRFNKHILIEKLKTNPDEIIEFKGSNLSVLPGYS